MPNFYERIAGAAREHPASPAIEMLGEAGLDTMSYAELIATAEGFAGWLTESAGVRPGDRVAILAANDPRWVAAYLGVLRMGGLAVPLDTAYSAAQVRTVLADSAARVLFVSARLADTGRTAASDVRDCTVQFLGPIDAVAAVTAMPPAAVADDDPAVILYTSGTTADPKGVVLTHANLEAERAAALSVIHVTVDDAVLGVLPLFHALAQMANLLLPLSAGSRVVFLESINSTSLLAALQARPITVFACVPQFFYLIHQRVLGEVAKRGRVSRFLFHALIAANAQLRNRTGANLGRRLFARVHRTLGPRMRMLITGGSRFDPDIARDLYGLGLTLLNGYGLTETSGAATVVRPDDRFTTSVGQPLPGTEIRIANDTTIDDDGTPGTGEVLIRGGIVTPGYFRRPDATAESLRDGWLHTGDLGYLDHAGRLFITGRRKEMIVLSSGKNLYPEEIEAHYRQSGFIKELCVLGLSRPGQPAAERLHAVVVPDEDALRARGTVNVRELLRFEIEGLSVRLPAHKRILTYDIALEPLPRTTTGKLRRGELERRILSNSSSNDDGSLSTRSLSSGEEAWLLQPRHGHLIEIIAAQLGRPMVAPDANLELDLGLDSMERVELLTAVETAAGRRVPADARAGIFTIRQLVEAALAGAPASSGRTAAAADTNESLGETPAVWADILAEGPDPAVGRDLARPAFVRALVWRVALMIAAVPARLLIRWDVRGRHRLPASGPFLICPNHQSYLDGFFLAAALPFGAFRQLFLVGAAEYFQTPLRRRLARAANIVPVDADANLVSAMQAAAVGLRLGKILMLFPEGERSIDGVLRPFRKGAAILASSLRVPIVPVAITGLYPLWPRGRPIQWRRLQPWRRPRVTLTFASPLRPASSDYAGTTAELQAAVAKHVNAHGEPGRTN